MMSQPSGATYSIFLGKEDFKFSAAHFTVFGDLRAELLHGHNYQVEVALEGDAVDENGLLCDFVHVKGTIRRLCARWDSRMLIPAENPHLTIRQQEGEVAVIFRDRRYAFPAADVLLLPLVNSSIELFARLLWEELARALDIPWVHIMAVTVGETAGQRCVYRAPLRGRNVDEPPE